MESPAHLKIKNAMVRKFKEWYPGVEIKEYYFSGQRVDFFYTSYQGVTITVEVIWRSDKLGYLQDFDIIQNSLGQIKLVIVDLESMDKLKLRRDFDKIRISEIRKGYIISEPFDGKSVLEKDGKYFEYIKDFIDFSLTLITTNYSKMEYHFSDIKRYVVEPLFSYIKHNRRIPLKLEECPVDKGLFSDFLDNHYIQIKHLWRETKNLQDKHILMNKKIDDRINELLKRKLNKKKIPNYSGIRYESVTQEGIQRIKYRDEYKIPIKQVVERLANLIKSRIYSKKIDSRLGKNDQTNGETLIYFRQEDTTLDYEAQIIRTANNGIVILDNLRKIFDDINLDNTISKLVQELGILDKNRLNKIDELSSKLGQIRFMVNLRFTRPTCNFISGDLY